MYCQCIVNVLPMRILSYCNNNSSILVTKLKKNNVLYYNNANVLIQKNLPFLPGNGYSTKNYQYSNCTGHVSSRTVVYPNCLSHAFGVTKGQCDSSAKNIKLVTYKDSKCETESGSLSISSTNNCKSGTYYSECGQIVSSSNQVTFNFMNLILVILVFYSIN